MCPEGILVHFLMTLFPRGEKKKMFLVPDLEFVFVGVSAAACFVSVHNPRAVLLHPRQAAVVGLA